MAQNIRITDAELDIMQVVWDRNEPVAFREICETLRRGAKKVTVQTLITRLVEKGALRQEKRGVYYYSALVSRQEFEQEKTEELIQKIYRGDVRKLFAALAESKSITEKDVGELRRFWEEANGDA